MVAARVAGIVVAACVAGIVVVVRVAGIVVVVRVAGIVVVVRVAGIVVVVLAVVVVQGEFFFGRERTRRISFRVQPSYHFIEIIICTCK